MSPYRALLALALVIAAAACDRGTTEPPAGPASFVHELAFVDPPQFGWEGQTLPVVVRGTDTGGEGVPGVRVQFRTVIAAGSLSAADVLTDTLGRAAVDFTLGWDASGWNALEAFIDNPAVAPVQWGISIARRPRVSFERNNVVLARPGAEDTLFARVLDAQGELMLGHSVSFTATEPGVVSFFTIFASGTIRGMLAGVRAERVGSTRVIATHPSGAADTAQVQVLPGTP